METIATHPGTVVATREGVIEIQITAYGACNTCEAQKKCGFAETKNKTVIVRSKEWGTYQAGDRVMVHINKSLGLLSVLIAYVLPAIVLIMAVSVPVAFGVSEGLSAIIGIVSIGAYFMILYSQRNKLEKKFTFTISKHE